MSLMRGARGAAGERRLADVSPAAPALAAEYITCMIIIVVTCLTKDKGYTDKMTELLWRSTATTAVFFVLAMASMSQKASKITVAFGALIVLGILYNATSTVKTTLDALAGAGTGVSKTDSATLEASTQPPHTIQTVPSTA